MKLAFGIVSTLFFSPPSPAHRPPVFPASIRLRARTQTARPIRGPQRSLPPVKTRVASVGRPAKHDLGGNLHAQRSFAAGYTLAVASALLDPAAPTSCVFDLSTSRGVRAAFVYQDGTNFTVIPAVK